MSIKETILYNVLRRGAIKYRRYANIIMYSIAPVYETKAAYKRLYGRDLDLIEPQSINEKLQYLKLNDYYKNKLVSICSDKYRIRRYLKKQGVEELLPKLYGVYTNANDIDWDKLPRQFVLKCNHGCGYNIICNDLEKLDRKQAIHSLNGWMKQDYWRHFGEFHYKYIKKAIIAEEFLGDEIATYKFYCFNGEPKVLYVSYNGENGEKDKYVTYYNLELKQLPYRLGTHEIKEGDMEKPQNYEEMVSYARKLSKDFPFVRVDLYNISGRIYISELTFLPTGGHMDIKPDGTDLIWGVARAQEQIVFHHNFVHLRTLHDT